MLAFHRGPYPLFRVDFRKTVDADEFFRYPTKNFMTNSFVV